MILKIFTEMEELPESVKSFGENPDWTEEGWLDEVKFYSLNNDYLYSDDQSKYLSCISQEKDDTHRIPLNKEREPMYFAWDDWDWCAVVQSKEFFKQEDIVWKIFAAPYDIKRYDMPDGTTFLVGYHG